MLLPGLLAGALLAETGLRILGPALGPALRAFVSEEAQAWAASSARVVGGTRLVLREADFQRGADVVILGDSMAFGTLVDEDALFSTELARRSGLRVLNLGIASAGPCIYERMLGLALARLPRPPGLILYSIFANDIAEPACGTLRDDDVYVWEGAVRNQLSFRVRQLRERIFRHSVAYQLVKRYVGFGSLNAGPSFAPIVFNDGQRAFLFAPPGWWRPQLDLASVGAGFERLLEHVARAASQARLAGSKLVVVLMPFKEQIQLHELVASGALPAAHYDPLYDAVYDTLASRVAALNVPTADLREPLRAKARTGAKLYWTLDGHLTPEGHRAVADALAARVASASSGRD